VTVAFCAVYKYSYLLTYLCNMGCSRQFLMKVAPVNGVNVYTLGLFIK